MITCSDGGVGGINSIIVSKSFVPANKSIWKDIGVNSTICSFPMV